MKATAEKIEKNIMSLEVEVPQEEFAKAYEKAAREIAGKVNIPGFRKGKVPTSVLEKNVGVESIINDAVEAIIPKAYYEAVDETGIEPIDQPDVELVKAEKDQPLVFRARVQVKPEVALGDYKGLKVEKKVFEISESDVNAELEVMRGRYAKMEEVEEGTLENGDVALFDFAGYVDDVAFPGGSAEDYSLEIGSGSFIPGFEEQMVGMVPGEEKDINVEFPAEYHAEELAGKPAVFKVTLKGIKRKKVADLDDDFARDVSEFDTLDELKEDLKKKMQKSSDEMSQGTMRMDLLEKAAENADVEVPEVMISAKIDSYVKELENRLRQQGMDLNMYLQMSGMDLEKIREEYRPQASSQVKIDLMLEAVAAAEDLKVSDEELTSEIERMAVMYGQEPDNMRKFFEAQGTLEHISGGIRLEKAVALIEEHADVTEVPGVRAE